MEKTQNFLNYIDQNDVEVRLTSRTNEIKMNNSEIICDKTIDKNPSYRMTMSPALTTVDEPKSTTERAITMSQSPIPRYLRGLLSNPSLKDLEEMDFESLVEFDKRGFWKMYWDSLVDDHILLVPFIKRSILIPRFVRLIFMFFSLSLDFGLNAFFYSDDYIEDRTDQTLIGNDTGFFYSLIDQLPKSIWSIIVSSFIVMVVQKFKSPSKKMEEEMAEVLKSRNVEEIIEAE